jgi:hypothetical protein
MATMLLWLSVAGGQMACVLPQEDQIITELPGAANRPPRILPGIAEPPQRESTVQLGANCNRTNFSVQVDDPNPTDSIRALWFIDPNERYVQSGPNQPVIQGNPGSPIGAGSTVRLVQANTQFFAALARFNDGRKHRVEVVVTDGEFIESERPDPQGGTQAFLDIVRPAIRTASGEVIPVAAYRDEFVWLVEVETLPCP